jgi:hypothetical protein
MPRVVTIGATDLTKHVRDVQIRQITETHSQYHEATIVLDVAGLSEYYHVNLRDRVIIESEQKREFSGVVIESYPIDAKIHVLDCRSAAQHLQELVITQAAFENFTPQEIVYHLVKQTSDVDASERSIHGLVLNKEERDFFVAVRVHSLVIKKPVTISNVTFFKLEPTSHDTKVMVEKGKWIEGTAIASLTVRAPGFIEAWTNGRDTISRLVDALCYGATLSTLGHPTRSGNYETYDWLRVNTLSKLYLKDLESALRTASIRKADGSLMTLAELRQLSARSASRINNVDLRERFDAFVRNRTQTVTITTTEYDCIWGNGGLREQRNGLEHGRSVHVDEDALKIMKHVLDKMILAVVI